MIKVCLNCDTENALDAVFCSECGMSLTRAAREEAAQLAPGLWMRRTARALALVWAGYWTVSYVSWVWNPGGDWGPADYWPAGMVATLVLASWVAAAVPWRWEHAGAGLLLFATFVLPLAGYAFLISLWGPEGSFVLSMGCLISQVPMALLALPASRLLLVSWRRSRTAERQRGTDAAKRYHQTGESLRGVDLSGCDLAELDLSTAELHGANLAEANLERGMLMGASLAGADLRDSNLSHANLEGADLSNAVLARANLQDAELKSADLRQAFLYRADLQGAMLRGANLEEADLRYADLEGANLEGAHLAGAQVSDGTIMPAGWEEVVASRPEDEPG